MTPEEEAKLPENVMWEGRFIAAKTRGKWEYVGRTRGIHAAVIIAIDEAEDGRHLLLVDQYRVALLKRCIEIPAGLVGDDDDKAGEHASIAAARELEEETGYRAGRMEVLGEFYSSPGMVSESFTLFRAHDLVRVAEGGGVGDEEIRVHRVPLDGFADWVRGMREQGYAIDVRLLAFLGSGMIG